MVVTHGPAGGAATPATAAERPSRTFIGYSDAQTIMAMEETALLRLWREKRGEADPVTSPTIPHGGQVLLILLNSQAAFRKSVALRFANTQALSTILRARILKNYEGNWS